MIPKEMPRLGVGCRRISQARTPAHQLTSVRNAVVWCGVLSEGMARCPSLLARNASWTASAKTTGVPRDRLAELVLHHSWRPRRAAGPQRGHSHGTSRGSPAPVTFAHRQPAGRWQSQPPEHTRRPSCSGFRSGLEQRDFRSVEERAELGTMQGILDRHFPRSKRDLRGGEWYYLQTLCGQQHQLTHLILLVVGRRCGPLFPPCDGNRSYCQAAQLPGILYIHGPHHRSHCQAQIHHLPVVTPERAA